MAKKLNWAYQQVFGDIHMRHDIGLFVADSGKTFDPPWKNTKILNKKKLKRPLLM